jgi:hypothetical protein
MSLQRVMRLSSRLEARERMTHTKVINLVGESVVLKHQVNALLDTPLKSILDEHAIE